MSPESQNDFIRLLQANPGRFYPFISKALNKYVVASKLRAGSYPKFPPDTYQVRTVKGQTYIAYNPHIDED